MSGSTGIASGNQTETQGIMSGLGQMQAAVAPPSSSASPQAQGMYSRYASLPTEKLQELASQLGGSAQGQIIQTILRQKQAEPAVPQIVSPVTQGGMPGSGLAAIAPQGVRRGGTVVRRADGGPSGPSPSEGFPSWSRGEAQRAMQVRPGQGFLAGATDGRADKVLTTAPAGAYVLPADVVSALGEGNSLAGARKWQEAMSTGPFGMPLPRGVRGMGLPRPPRAFPIGHAKGGATGGHSGTPTPVALSDGEIVVHPEDVLRFGKGDIKRGHRELDKFVLAVRKKYRKTLGKLPGPVKT